MDNGASSYRRYLDGDASAFDEIVKDFFNSLVFFIDRYVQDPAAAEDIAIDVFSDLIVHKHRYNFKVQLKTYLFMLGRSRALNYLRRRKLLRIVPLEQAQEVADRQELEEKILSDQRKQVLNAALAQLSEDMRLAIHLVYFEDLSYEETAKVMKKTPKQVDNLLYRSKKTLRTILGKEAQWLL